VNVKEYIASGIVESYVLGLASKEEMAEFERMAAAHHEVRMARDAFEKLLEEQALANAIKPPVHVKSKVLAELEVEADKLKSNGNTIVADPEQAEQVPVVVAPWWKYAAAASIVLLLGSAALNIYYMNEVKTYKNLYLTAQTEYAQREDSMRAQLTAYQSSMDRIRDTGMAVVRMKGTAKFPESMATVYWDTKSKDVYLLVNNLPQPATGKQYQLWAIVNGKPVDAGMLQWSNTVAVKSMKNIPAAQAFAITLENEGGSPAPTMEAMYVYGAL